LSNISHSRYWKPEHIIYPYFASVSVLGLQKQLFNSSYHESHFDNATAASKQV
jgi:hypothetical protein